MHEINLVQDTEQWQALVKMTINLCVLKCWKFD